MLVCLWVELHSLAQTQSVYGILSGHYSMKAVTVIHHPTAINSHCWTQHLSQAPLWTLTNNTSNRNKELFYLFWLSFTYLLAHPSLHWTKGRSRCQREILPEHSFTKHTHNTLSPKRHRWFRINIVRTATTSWQTTFFHIHSLTWLSLCWAELCVSACHGRLKIPLKGKKVLFHTHMRTCTPIWAWATVLVCAYLFPFGF